MPWRGAIVVLTAWSAGIMAAVLGVPPAALALPAGLALLAGLLAAATLPRRETRALLLILAALGLLLGLGRGLLAPGITLPGSISGQQVAIVGVIDDDPATRRGGARVVIRAERVVAADAAARDLRLIATLYGAPTLQVGDRVLVTGRLEPPDRFEQFDYPAYLAERGIGGVLRSPRLVRVLASGGASPGRLLILTRHALVDAVDRALPEPQAALLLGTVFGYRAALPPDLQQNLVRSGLIHIVVVSGLKVSLLARMVQSSVGRVLPRAASPVALLVMIGYALLSGSSAAALRATAMGGLVVLAGALRRDTQVYASMALTAAFMLAVKPALAKDVSFLLSFSGTLGIATLTDPIASRLHWLPRILRDPFAATLAAEAATWPLMLANFHVLSLVAPLANALVLPLLPLLMIVGGGGAILAVVKPVVAWPALQAAGLLTNWILWVVARAAELPGAALTISFFPARLLTAALLLNGGGLAALSLRRRVALGRGHAATGLAGILLIALLLVQPDGRVHVYALDVGTGSAVLVRTAHGEQVLLDAGPDADRLAQALGRALPATARRISAWIVTGGHRQQIGGAAAVLDRFAVGRLLVSDPDPWSASLRAVLDSAAAHGVPVQAGATGLTLDGVRIALLGDGRTWLVQAGAARLAIVPPDGDAEGLPPVLLLTRGGPENWAGRPAPALALLEVSALSRDGLPARALIEDLRGSRLMRTDRLGTIELTDGPAGFAP